MSLAFPILATLTELLFNALDAESLGSMYILSDIVLAFSWLWEIVSVKVFYRLLKSIA